MLYKNSYTQLQEENPIIKNNVREGLHDILQHYNFSVSDNEILISPTGKEVYNKVVAPYLALADKSKNPFYIKRAALHKLIRKLDVLRGKNTAQDIIEKIIGQKITDIFGYDMYEENTVFNTGEDFELDGKMWKRNEGRTIGYYPHITTHNITMILNKEGKEKHLRNGDWGGYKNEDDKLWTQINDYRIYEIDIHNTNRDNIYGYIHYNTDLGHSEGTDKEFDEMKKAGFKDNDYLHIKFPVLSIVYPKEWDSFSGKEKNDLMQIYKNIHTIASIINHDIFHNTLMRYGTIKNDTSEVNMFSKFRYTHSGSNSIDSSEVVALKLMHEFYQELFLRKPELKNKILQIGQEVIDDIVSSPVLSDTFKKKYIYVVHFLLSRVINIKPCIISMVGNIQSYLPIHIAMNKLEGNKDVRATYKEVKDLLYNRDYILKKYDKEKVALLARKLGREEGSIPRRSRWSKDKLKRNGLISENMDIKSIIKYIIDK